MFSIIKNLIDHLDVEGIPLSRKRDLNNLTDYINHSLATYKKAQLNFICTHNSRRSHLCQIWAQTMANYYKLPNVTSFSGGTETTALFPKIAQTIEKQGFQVAIIDQSENPLYAIQFDEESDPILCFSKVYDHYENPKENFAAIMTCDHASENCPVVLGADQRIAITYKDPKSSDGTPEQEQVYLERSIQIATEMKYVFSQITTA